MAYRNNEIKIRLTDDELYLLNDKVAKTKHSREEYVRSVLNDTKIIERPPIEYGEILRELRRIGSNVDQILVKLRSLGFADNREISKALDSIRNMDKTFRGFFV